MEKFNLEELVNSVKAQEAISLAKANDLIEAIKANDLLKKKEQEEIKKNNTIAIILGIVGGIALICAIGYALYLYFSPDYLEDFEDDFDDIDDDFEDDFFESEDEKKAKYVKVEVPAQEEEPEVDTAEVKLDDAE